MKTAEARTNGAPELLPPPEAKAPVEDRYDLTQDEQSLLQGYNYRAITAKAKLFDLEEAKRAAQLELEQVQTQFNGALNGIAGAHGIKGGQLSQDFKSIVKGGQQ